MPSVHLFEKLTNENISKTKMPNSATARRTFSQAALDDFKEFQDAGITHPDMEKIKALLVQADNICYERRNAQMHAIISTRR